MTLRARLLGVAVLLALGLAACGGASPSVKVVARVAGKPITRSAYEHWLLIFAEHHVQLVPPDFTACMTYIGSREPGASEEQRHSACAKSYATDKRKALTFLISSQWILGEAKEAGVSVSKREVEQEIANRRRQDYPNEAAFRRFLQESGYSLSDLAFKTEMELLPPKIEEKIANEVEKEITPAVIASYYEKHKSDYTRHEEKGAYLLLAKTEAQANAAIREIASGKSFAEVAKGVSIFHTNEGGGVYYTASRDEVVEQSLEYALFNAKPNVLIGPIKAAAGYYVLEVTKTRPAGPKPLSEVAAEIGQQLTTQRIKAELSRRSAASEQKWKSRTTCNAEYMVAQCGKRMS